MSPIKENTAPVRLDEKHIDDSLSSRNTPVVQLTSGVQSLVTSSSSSVASSTASTREQDVAGAPLEHTQTAQDSAQGTALAQRTTSNSGPLYSVFSTNQKRFIVFMASWAGFFSPVSSNIYFPALNVLAADLKVSNSLINLTLTSYLIFQGLAPAFIGNLADSMGRRPAYFVCFTIYLAANIGLALQNSYAALFVLRCLQSSGSSGTIAMSSAVVSDVSTPAERGKYMGFVLAGSLFGPAIGPVLGGILTQFLGWRSIFWFLVIFGGAFMVIFAIFFPETARQIVGNGSTAPKGWNMSLMNYLAIRAARRNDQSRNEDLTPVATSDAIPRPRARFPNPLSSMRILLDKENALLLFYTGFMFAAFYDMTAIIPSEFARVYHFNDLQIGLCYIPIGAGSMAAALVNGQLLDRNFRRWCNKLGVAIKKGRNQDLRNFPIEKARLQLAIPASYVAAALVLVFGWVLDEEGPLAVVLVVLFFGAFALGIAFNVTSTLLVDFYPGKAATATAANNLVRCLLGAAATAVVSPMVNGMGLGWCFTFLSLFLVVTSPMLWVVMWKGMQWREERRLKEEANEKKAAESKATHEEEGKRPAEREQSQGTLVEGGLPEAEGVAEREKEVQR